MQLLAFLQEEAMTEAEKASEKALDIAIDLTKQLITLSTAVVSVVVAILGLFKSVSVTILPNLTGGVVLEFISIIFGLLVHGTITAALNNDKKLDVVYGKAVISTAILQWIFFLTGLAWLLYSLLNYVHPGS